MSRPKHIQTEPDWATLRALADQLCYDRGWTKPEWQQDDKDQRQRVIVPSYSRLASETGAPRASVYDIKNGRPGVGEAHWPSREALEMIAKKAGDPIRRWTVPGGFPADNDDPYAEASLSPLERDLLARFRRAAPDEAHQRRLFSVLDATMEAQATALRIVDNG